MRCRPQQNKKLDENEEQKSVITDGPDEALSDSDEFSDGDQEPTSPGSGFGRTNRSGSSGSTGNLSHSVSLQRSTPSIETVSVISGLTDTQKAKKVKQKIAVELSRLVNVVEAVKYHSLARGLLVCLSVCLSVFILFE